MTNCEGKTIDYGMDYISFVVLLDLIGVAHYTYTAYSTDGKNTPCKAVKLTDTGRTVFFDADDFMENIVNY